MQINEKGRKHIPNSYDVITLNSSQTISIYNSQSALERDLKYRGKIFPFILQAQWLLYLVACCPCSTQPPRLSPIRTKEFMVGRRMCFSFEILY